MIETIFAFILLASGGVVAVSEWRRRSAPSPASPVPGVAASAPAARRGTVTIIDGDIRDLKFARSHTISEAGLQLIKDSEGLRKKAYRNPGDVWTIGYGHTRTAREGMMISEGQADALLREDVKTAEADVKRLVTVEITQGQYDALVSFAFNFGGPKLSTSTLLKKLNAGDPQGAAAEFGRWIKAGNEVLPGLVTRRAAEQTLFQKGTYS